MPVIAENIKKVAVIMQGEQTQFLELDQGRPLAAIIKDLCDVWSLQDPDNYALQFTEPNRQAFITERNRIEIQNGNVLRLSYSPAKTAQEILDQLHYGSKDDQLGALRQLAELATDNTFAQEFINKQGLYLIISMVEGGSYAGESLAYTLKAFVELMDHGIVSWDVLEQKFIKTVSSAVNPRTVADATTLQSSLEILESIALHSSGKYSLVEAEVTPVNLIQHLQSTNADIQKSAIALINALFAKADPAKRKRIADSLQSKSIRNVILNNVIRGKTIGTEMAHQLYVLQSLLFSLLDERSKTPIPDPNDQGAQRDLNDLRKIAFDADQDASSTTTKRHSHSKDYKKLGFQNHVNPAEDFRQTPPGMLALDNMIYFAKNHGENYTKVVLENSCRADEHDCPFAKASLELTTMLCEILKVGEQPTEEGQVYYPMFFTHDHPFEEFYSICIQLLNKTWKEMRATSEDFTKVLAVAREQVSRALEEQPTSFDGFKQKLSRLTYGDITNLWQQERRHKEEWESQAKPIVELRDQITPEILDLIKQQRLHYLSEGTRFTKYNAKGHRMKDKFWYCRLSPNHKVFYYGDCEEDKVPSFEDLAKSRMTNKLPVVDIKSLVTGKDCPHIKDKKKGSNVATGLAFSIISEADVTETNVDFIAPNEADFQIWTDGINALLGNPMTSELTKQDLEMLLGMEIKLRLLDTEGVVIPENPPPIPKEPPNYDFAYSL